MDWNNDGKKDLLLGDVFGNVRVYLNVGSDGAPVFGTSSFIQVGGTVFSAAGYATPCVVDWNKDGKKDILCGNNNGRVYLLLNTGTDEAPLFGGSLFVQDGAAALNAVSYSVPAPVDWDRDGRMDLLVGEYSGAVRFYRNQGTDENPVFHGFTNLTAEGTVLDIGYYSHPAVTDWNGDGGNDLVVGCNVGFVARFLAIVEPTIVYDGVELDDAAGNGDGTINCGEPVTLRVTLRNLGLNDATGVVATLSCTDGYVTVADNTASYGDVPGTEKKEGGDPFEIQIAANCPTPRQVELVLTVTDAIGKAWTASFEVMVYTACRISGTVTLDGTPTDGVTVMYTGPTIGMAMTDSQGAYSFGAIDGVYTVSAGKGDWLDSEPRNVTAATNTSGVNFAFLTAKVAGQITDVVTTGTIAGASVEYAGGLAGLVAGGNDGRYEFSRVYGRATTLTVTAKKAGYFDSTPVNVTLPPDAAGVDFTMLHSGNGIGLLAEYFDNVDFTGLQVTRVDPTVDFDWGNGSPDASLAADTFSARWTGQVQAPWSETYTFYTVSDDGVRLWVNGQLLVDKWVNQGPTEYSGTIALAAGQKYDLKMEYYENGGGATARLLWSSPSTAKQVLPTSQLYLVSDDPDTDGDGIPDSEDPDDDNDGMSDADELIAGTIPTNAASVLRISHAAISNPQSEIVIRWQSASNRWYTVEAGSNLADGFTMNLCTNIPATPPENVRTDAVGVAGYRFYRVRVEQE